MQKILVSTVGSWSEVSGANTMSEIFRGYNKEHLASLYIRAERSDSQSCNHYFHIFEGRVMKSVFAPRIITGEEYYSNQIQHSNQDLEEEKARYVKYSQKRIWFFLFAREFVWILGHWKSKELNKFLDNYNPEVLVCPIESYIHFNRINEYIIKRKHPRVIGFLWDDNFTYKQNPKSIGYKIHRWWLRHSVKRMVNYCETVVALSPKMKEEADKEFGIKCELLTKPIFNQPEYKEYAPATPIRILYTGNLYVNRDKTLACVVDAIRKVNENGQKVVLDVYTSTAIEPELDDRIKVKGCCEVHPPIKQSEVLQLQKEADVLLFIEDLWSKTGGDARLSFSTKLTDYFCAGKCIWAVGGNQTSAMDYLSERDAAICADNEKAILETLEEIAKDTDTLTTYSHKAWQCGHDFHDAKIIQEKLKRILKFTD